MTTGIWETPVNVKLGARTAGSSYRDCEPDGLPQTGGPIRDPIAIAKTQKDHPFEQTRHGVLISKEARHFPQLSIGPKSQVPDKPSNLTILQKQLGAILGERHRLLQHD